MGLFNSKEEKPVYYYCVSHAYIMKVYKEHLRRNSKRLNNMFWYCYPFYKMIEVDDDDGEVYGCYFVPYKKTLLQLIKNKALLQNRNKAIYFSTHQMSCFQKMERIFKQTDLTDQQTDGSDQRIDGSDPQQIDESDPQQIDGLDQRIDGSTTPTPTTI
jgi:hypothetical protein